jgi:hypothetical protein
LRAWARPLLFAAGLLIGFPEWISTLVGLAVVAIVVALRKYPRFPGPCQADAAGVS